MHKLSNFILLLGSLLLSSVAHGQIPQNSTPKTVELSFNMHRIQAELAADDATRQRGLMFRTHMPAEQGMLFVFEQKQTHCMWMRNTLLPLSVAFLDDEGKIINIENMAPQTENNHCASRPARYALEMNQGWFKTRNAQAGQEIRGVKGLYKQ